MKSLPEAIIGSTIPGAGISFKSTFVVNSFFFIVSVVVPKRYEVFGVMWISFPLAVILNSFLFITPKSDPVMPSILTLSASFLSNRLNLFSISVYNSPASITSSSYTPVFGLYVSSTCEGSLTKLSLLSPEGFETVFAPLTSIVLLSFVPTCVGKLLSPDE